MLRIIIGILGAISTGLFNSQRAGLNVAIVRMAKYNSTVGNDEDISGSCYTSPANSSNEQTVIRGEFEWSESVQEIMVGATYYMYLITPTLAGRITERFGSKWVATVAVITPAALYSLIPTAAYFSVNLVIVILLIMGFFHGCIFACMFPLYANWFPESNRAIAIGGLYIGSSLGNILGSVSSGYLCEYGFAGGWPSVFYVLSLIHLPWLVLWLMFVEDTPLISNRKGFVKISDKELKYIESNIKTFGTPENTVKAPWVKIFLSKVVWATIITKICSGWGLYTVQSRMPAYLDKVFGIPMTQNGLFTAGTSLAGLVSMTAGAPLSVYIINKTSHKLSRTTVRKIFELTAFLGSGTCLVIITIVGCNSDAVVVFLILALFFHSLMSGGEIPAISELAPDFSGSVLGIIITLSVFPAFVAPYTLGVLLGDQPGDKSLWNKMFYITVGIYAFGALVFGLFGSAEAQEWGLIDKNNKKIKKQNLEN